jgi:uncharacterized repeat protein (TIGR03803 family)
MNNNRKKNQLIIFNMKLVATIISLSLFTVSMYGQYIHPNQPGRKAKDMRAGIGNQVITTTYIGNAGNGSSKGTMVSINKDGSNKAVIREFVGAPSDGAYNYWTSPIQASDGQIYGSSYEGGSNNRGGIYKFDLKKCDPTMINHEARAGGGNRANINELSDGKIYYIHPHGGKYEGGVLKRMNKDGSNVEILHEFHEAIFVKYSDSAKAQRWNYDGSVKVGASNSLRDGMWPYGFVVEGADGKIYGTTLDGGAFSFGAVYRCDKDGKNYEIISALDPTFRPNYYNTTSNIQLSARMPLYPHGNVAQTKDGKIIFCGHNGGEKDLGAYASMDANGGNFKILFSCDEQKGYHPTRGPLVINDKVYGTTKYGGRNANMGGEESAIGTVFSVGTNGLNYKILKAFSYPYKDGVIPWAGLSYDGSYLYGTTFYSGASGSAGTLFKLKTNGQGFTTILSFKDGELPSCNGKKGGYFYYPSGERVTFGNVQLKCALNCVEAYSCPAGTAAPIISKSTDTIKCPDSIYNLNRISASNLPAGCKVTWHTSQPAHFGNEVKDPINAVSGSYFACISI